MFMECFFFFFCFFILMNCFCTCSNICALCERDIFTFSINYLVYICIYDTDTCSYVERMYVFVRCSNVLLCL